MDERIGAAGRRRIVAFEVEALDHQGTDRPVRPLLDHVKIIDLEPVGLQRIAQPDAGYRRAALDQFIERPGEPRRLPAADRDLAELPGPEIGEQDAALEQADLDRSDGRRSVKLHLHLDLGSGVLLDQRHRRHGTADQQDDDDGGNEEFLHGSASGCFEGCAASNAGCFRQAAWMRWMVGNFDMSTLKRAALKTCGTRQRSAMVG